VVSGPVAATNLSRAGSRVARAAWESALTSCTGVGKGAEEPRVGGWTRRGFSHRGGAKRRQTLAIGQVFVSAAGGAEGVVIDRYVGRIVHGSVPGCRSHPRSTERRLTRLGAWGAAQVMSLAWWHW
jgi:hypothetical protein